MKLDLSTIPAYSGQSYVAVNDNVPFFSESDLTDVSFESYGDLDALGRCSVAYASVGTDIMPCRKTWKYWSGETYWLAYSEV